MNIDAPAASRKERVDARVTQEEKRLFERAASLSGCSLTSFVVSTCVTAAREVIRDHEIINLSAADREAFVTALCNPPEPNEALKSAARGYDEVVTRRY